MLFPLVCTLFAENVMAENSRLPHATAGCYTELLEDKNEVTIRHVPPHFTIKDEWGRRAILAMFTSDIC